MKSIRNIALLGMLYILGACSTEESLYLPEEQLLLEGIKGTYKTTVPYGATIPWETFVKKMGSSVSTSSQTIIIDALDFEVPIYGGGITFTFQPMSASSKLWGIYEVISPNKTQYMYVSIDTVIQALIYSDMENILEEVTDSLPTGGSMFLLKDI